MTDVLRIAQLAVQVCPKGRRQASIQHGAGSTSTGQGQTTATGWTQTGITLLATNPRYQVQRHGLRQDVFSYLHRPIACTMELVGRFPFQCGIIPTLSDLSYLAKAGRDGLIRAGHVPWRSA